MAREFGVVIPNRYPDIIRPLVESINRLVPDPKPEIVIVADGHQNGYGFRMVPYPDSFFVFSKSANTGFRALGRKDVILMNDDCVLLEEDFFHKLHEAMAGQERIGILSPLIVGCVGNVLQRWHERDRWWPDDVEYQSVPDGYEALCFPCVCLSRLMLDQIGLMDEAYCGYGRDDWDMCLRARKAGWSTTVVSTLKIQHGDGSAALSEGRGKSWSTSYVRRFRDGRPRRVEINDYLMRNKIPRQKI